MKVIITAPRVFSDFEGYESPASGKWIEGRRARLEDFARTGTRPHEAGEAADAARARARLAQELDAQVEVAVERTLTDMTL